MENPNDLLTYCKIKELKSTIDLYNPETYKETGIYSVLIVPLKQYFTVLFDGERINWLHTAHGGGPIYEAYRKHNSYVHSVNEDGRNRASFPLTIKDLKDKYDIVEHKAEL